MTQSIDEKLASYSSREHEGIGYIQTMTATKNLIAGAVPSCDLQLRLVGYQFEEVLVIKFFGVVELKIKDLNGIVMTYLKITDISSWQLEGIRLRVTDEESDVISFSCSDFELVASY